MTNGVEKDELAMLVERLSAVERDSRDHAKSLTALVQASQEFSDEQIAQMRATFRGELGNAGIRLDEADQVDEAREDFRFLRRLRRSWDGAVNKTGSAVMFALIGIAATIIGLGFWAWINNNLK